MVLKENEMINIVAVGDSVGRGVIKNEDTEKYEVSDKSFSEICKGKLNVLIENCCRFGSSILKGEKLLDRAMDKIEQENSKYVLFIFGGNDCNFNWDEVSQNPDGNHLSETPIPEFKKKYSQLIKKIQDMGKMPILLSLPPIASLKFFNTICLGRNKENILKFLKGTPYSSGAWHMRYNIEVFKLGVENKVPVIDITTPFLDERNYEHLFCDDGMHPNETGHALIAEAIQMHIKNGFLSIHEWKDSVRGGVLYKTI